MSAEIDKRVVEMQFDNKQFERNVQTSLSTLDKLKMALNFDGAKGLDSITQAAKKMDLSNITNQTERVQVSFSALQVAGMTMVSELTKSFMNFGKNLWNISFGQMKSGGMARALKIEQADFKMKALVDKMDRFKDDAAGATQYIKDMGEAIDWAVTGTAYGYDSAASVAAQLMASGHDDVEQMRKDLRAVAGAAAMTGRSYDDMGRIFAAVAGQGRMMGDQLLQFSNGGINAAATIADYLGKSEKEVRDMVSKGKIDFQTFSDAMYDAYGEAAGKADETYAGVLSNVKAQLSRLGQRFAQPYIKNMIPFLQQVKATIKEISRVLTPVAERFDQIFGRLTNWGRRVLKDFNATKMSIGFRSLENILWGVAMVLHTVHDAFVEVFPPKTTEEVITLAESIEAFTEEILPTKEALDGLKQILKAIFTPFRALSKLIGVITKFARPLFASLLKIGYAVTSIFRVLEPFVNGILNILLGSVDILDSGLNIITTAVIYLSAVLQVLIQILSDALLAFIQSDRLKEIGNNIAEIGTKIKTFLINTLADILDLIYNIVSGINEAEEGTSWFSRVYNNAKQLWEVMKQLGMVFIDWFNTADSMKGLSSITSFLGELFGLVTNFFSGNDITGNVDGMSESVKRLGDAIKEMADKFKASWDSIDKGTIMMVLFGVSILFLISSLKNLVDNTSNFVSAMTNIPKVMSDIRRAIQNIGNFAGPAQTLLAFAAAVSSLTAAIVTLSKLPREDMIAAAVAIGAISAVLLGFTLAIDIFSKKANKDDKKINDTVVNLIALTASVVALAMSLKTVASLDMTVGDMLKSVGSIVLLMASLVTTVYLLNKIQPELKGSIITILGFSLSIMAIVKAFEMLAGINMEQMIEKIAAFGSLIILFGAAVGLAGSASGWATLTISAFTGSVIVLFGMFMLLTTIPMDLILDAIKVGTQVFNMFIPLILTIGVASKLAGKGTKLGGTVWALVLSMTAFLVTFMIFVRMVNKMGDSDVIERSMEMVKSIMTYMGVFVVVIMGIDAAMAYATRKDKHALANSMRANNTFRALASVILSMAASVLIIALAARTLNNTDPKGMVAIGIYILEIMALVAIVNHFSKTAKAGGMKVGPIVAMLSALGIVLAALIEFQFADSDKLVKSSVAILAALSGVAILFVGVSFIMKSFDKDSKKAEDDSKKVVSVLLSLLGFVASLAGLMIIVNNMETDKIISSMTGLIAILGTLAVIVAYFAGVPTDNYENAKQGIIAIYTLIPAVVALCAAMYGLSRINDKKIATAGKMIVGISAILIVMTGVLMMFAKICDKFDVDTDAVMSLAGSMAIIAAAVGVMGLAVLAIGQINPNDVTTATAIIVLLSLMLLAMEVVSVAIYKIAKFDWKDMAAIAGGMIAFASSVWIMSKAFAGMKQSVTPDELMAYALALGIMLAALTAVGAVAGYFGQPVIIGILGVATAFLEFGFAANLIAGACLKLSEAIKVLGSTTSEEVDNVVDSCIRFMNRIGDIVNAFKESYPQFIEGIQLLFRGIGTAIGVTIAEILNSVIIVGSAAIVDNLDILLASLYIVLRALVDWVASDEVLTLVSDAFTVLTMAAIAALDGLTLKIFGIRTSLKELFDDLQGYSFKEAFDQWMVDEDKESWTNAWKQGLHLISEYSKMAEEDMSDAQKESYANTIKYMNDLMREGIENDYLTEGEIGSEEYLNASGISKAWSDIYDSTESNADATKKIMSDFLSYGYDWSDDFNKMLNMQQKFGMSKIYDEDSFYSSGLFNDILKNGIDTSAVSDRVGAVNLQLEQDMDYLGNYIKMISQNYEDLETYSNVINGITYDNQWNKISKQIEDGLNKDIEESKYSIEDAEKALESFNLSGCYYIDGVSIRFRRASEDAEKMSYSYENAKVNNEELLRSENEHVSMMDKMNQIYDSTNSVMNQMTNMVNDASGGYDRLSYTINRSPIRPKFDQAGLQLLNNNLNIVDNNFKKIAKAGETIDLTKELDDTTESTDNLNTETGETTSITDEAKKATDRFAASLRNLDAKFKNGSLGLGKYKNMLIDYIQDAKGWDLSFLKEDKEDEVAEDMFKTAAEARKYGAELVKYQSSVGMVDIPRWQTYIEDGKRVYTSLEDFVNKHVSSGKNAYESVFGFLGGDKAKEAATDAINTAKEVFDTMGTGLTDLGDSALETSEKTDALGDSIKSTLDVFTEFNKEVNLTSREVLKNFYSQIDGIKTWQTELEALASRGFNQNFLTELADQGPDAYERIHALYTMTEQDLTLFNKMYAEKLVMQNTTADEIRKSFVEFGVMLADDAELIGKDLGAKYDEAVAKAQAEEAKKKNGQMSDATKKRLAQMYDTIEKYQADQDFIKKWYDSNAVIGETAGEAIADGMSNTTTEGIIGTAAYIEAGKEMVEMIGKGIDKASPDILKGLENLGYASTETLKNSIEFEKVLTPVNEFRKGVYNQVKSSLKLFDEVKVKTDEELKKEQISTTQMLYNMSENLKRVGKWSYQLRQLAAKGMSEGLVEELRQMGPEAADKVDAFARMSASELKMANRYYEESVQATSSIADRMTSEYAKQGFAVALGLKKGVDDGKEDLLAKMYEIGAESSEGFKKGIDPDAANTAMILLGNNSLLKLMEALDVHSPSRKTYDIGVNTILGLTNGIADPTANAELLTTIADLGLKVKQAYDEATDEKYIRRPVSDLDNDIYQPVIRPMVDMSGVEMGIASFFANRQFSLSGTINNAFAAQRTGPSPDAIMITNAIDRLSVEQRAIRNDINNIRSDVSNLGNRIDGMYVRLDGNVLVGELVAPLDKAMGKKVISQKRGRM